MSIRWAIEEAALVALTLHFDRVVSGGKVADLQRVGMLSSLGEFSISLPEYQILLFFLLLLFR